MHQGLRAARQAQLCLTLTFLCHQRVDDGFQLLLGVCVGEDSLAHAVAVKRAFGGDVFGAKALRNGVNGCSATQGNGACDSVSVNQISAARHQHLGDRAFAASNTARQSDTRNKVLHGCKSMRRAAG